MGTTPQREPYPPIGDYGFIADCHSSALVSRSGSIDWCCMPRIDSRSCFARLLDWKRAATARSPRSGHTRVRAATCPTPWCWKPPSAPKADAPACSTASPCAKAASGHRTASCCASWRAWKARWISRWIWRRCSTMGRFAPGSARHGDGQYTAIGGSDGLLVSGDFPLAMKHRHHLVGHCRVEPGQRVRLSLIYMQPEDLDQASVNVPETHELDRRLDETIEWWKAWSGRTRLASPYEQWVRRSAIVLKGLTHAPTGAIAAASTTSLPEAPGGQRNWDYRYSWVRDSAFTVRSLVQLGQVARSRCVPPLRRAQRGRQRGRGPDPVWRRRRTPAARNIHRRTGRLSRRGAGAARAMLRRPSSNWTCMANC